MRNSGGGKECRSRETCVILAASFFPLAAVGYTRSRFRRDANVLLSPDARHFSMTAIIPIPASQKTNKVCSLTRGKTSMVRSLLPTRT